MRCNVTEYRRTVRVSCPSCRSLFTGEVWVHDPAELERVLNKCPVCGSPTLRIDSPDDDVQFFAYLDMRKSISERIDEQQEDTYDYL